MWGWACFLRAAPKRGRCTARLGGSSGRGHGREGETGRWQVLHWAGAARESRKEATARAGGERRPAQGKSSRAGQGRLSPYSAPAASCLPRGSVRSCAWSASSPLQGSGRPMARRALPEPRGAARSRRAGTSAPPTPPAPPPPRCGEPPSCVAAQARVVGVSSRRPGTWIGQWVRADGGRPANGRRAFLRPMSGPGGAERSSAREPGAEEPQGRPRRCGARGSGSCAVSGRGRSGRLGWAAAQRCPGGGGSRGRAAEIGGAGGAAVPSAGPGGGQLLRPRLWFGRLSAPRRPWRPGSRLLRLEAPATAWEDQRLSSPFAQGPTS